MEEGVVDEGYRAVQLRLNTIVELECFARLVACREWYPLDFILRVLDVLACFSRGVEGPRVR